MPRPQLWVLLGLFILGVLSFVSAQTIETQKTSERPNTVGIDQGTTTLQGTCQPYALRVFTSPGSPETADERFYSGYTITLPVSQSPSVPTRLSVTCPSLTSGSPAPYTQAWIHSGDFTGGWERDSSSDLAGTGCVYDNHHVSLVTLESALNENPGMDEQGQDCDRTPLEVNHLSLYSGSISETENQLNLLFSHNGLSSSSLRSDVDVCACVVSVTTASSLPSSSSMPGTVGQVLPPITTGIPLRRLASRSMTTFNFPGLREAQLKARSNIKLYVNENQSNTDQSSDKQDKQAGQRDRSTSTPSSSSPPSSPSSSSRTVSSPSPIPLVYEDSQFAAFITENVKIGAHVNYAETGTRLPVTHTDKAMETGFALFRAKRSDDVAKMLKRSGRGSKGDSSYTSSGSGSASRLSKAERAMKVTKGTFGSGRKEWTAKGYPLTSFLSVDEYIANTNQQQHQQQQQQQQGQQGQQGQHQQQQGQQGQGSTAYTGDPSKIPMPKPHSPSSYNEPSFPLAHTFKPLSSTSGHVTTNSNSNSNSDSADGSPSLDKATPVDDLVLLETRASVYSRSKHSFALSTGFIIAAILEGLCPNAIQKAARKCEDVYENYIIPMQVDLLGGHHNIGGAPKSSFIEQEVNITKQAHQDKQNKNGQPSSSSTSSSSSSTTSDTNTAFLETSSSLAASTTGSPDTPDAPTGRMALAVRPGLIAITVSQNLMHILPVAIREMSEESAIICATDLHPYMVDKLRDWVSDAISKGLGQQLGYFLSVSVNEVVTDAVHRLLPPYLLRSLTTVLTHTVTRSVTHTLTGTLLHSLSTSPQHEGACYRCHNYGQMCEICHHNDPTRTKMYVKSYYSQFFASYYSDYYSNYYVNNGPWNHKDGSFTNDGSRGKKEYSPDIGEFAQDATPPEPHPPEPETAPTTWPSREMRGEPSTAPQAAVMP